MHKFKEIKLIMFNQFMFLKKYSIKIKINKLLHLQFKHNKDSKKVIYIPVIQLIKMILWDITQDVINNQNFVDTQNQTTHFYPNNS